MAKIINNSGSDLTVSIGTIGNSQVADLEGKELETALKIKGVELLETKEVFKKKKDKED